MGVYGTDAARFGKLGALAAALFLAVGAAAAPSQVLVHAEDFSRASKLDMGFWRAETGFFRNREAQYYRPGNVAVSAGALVIEARREPALNAAYDPGGTDWLTRTPSADYTSGSIVSREPLRFGTVEVVARLPEGAGTWPAIWTIFEAGLPYREIDVVEAVGSTPGRAFSTVSAGADLAHLRNWKADTPLPDLDSRFHTFRLDWHRDAISIAVDGHTVLKMDPEEARRDGIDPLRQPMNLRINLALGGTWGGRIDDAALPARLAIRSIRVWRDL